MFIDQSLTVLTISITSLEKLVAYVRAIDGFGIVSALTVCIYTPEDENNQPYYTECSSYFTSNDSFFDRQFLLHHRQFHRQFHLTHTIFLVHESFLSSTDSLVSSSSEFLLFNTDDFLPIDGPTVSSSTSVSWFLPFE